MPDPFPVRQLEVHLAQPHIRAVIEHLLPEPPPPPRLIPHRPSPAPTLTPPLRVWTPGIDIGRSYRGGKNRASEKFCMPNGQPNFADLWRSLLRLNGDKGDTALMP